MERKGEKKRKERIRRWEKKGIYCEGKGSERRFGKDMLSLEIRLLFKYLIV